MVLQFQVEVDVGHAYTKTKITIEFLYFMFHVIYSVQARRYQLGVCRNDVFLHEVSSFLPENGSNKKSTRWTMNHKMH